MTRTPTSDSQNRKARTFRFCRIQRNRSGPHTASWVPSGRANRWTFYIGGDGKIIYIEKGRGAVQTANAGETMIAKLEELATKGLVKRKK
jgi:hypothetical protein